MMVECWQVAPWGLCRFILPEEYLIIKLILFYDRDWPSMRSTPISLITDILPLTLSSSAFAHTRTWQRSFLSLSSEIICRCFLIEFLWHKIRPMTTPEVLKRPIDEH